jgi:hypothetical protein
MKAKFTIVERDAENNILFLKDNAYNHTMTITNDAENVVAYCRSLYGNKVRIVYMDTTNEWWEIKWWHHDPSRLMLLFALGMD